MKVTCRIKFVQTDVNVFDKDDWSKMIKFLVDASERMYKAFKNPVKKLNEWGKIAMSYKLLGGSWIRRAIDNLQLRSKDYKSSLQWIIYR